MPMTIRLLGFSTRFRTVAAHDALSAIFDDVSTHTDETFSAEVRRALAQTEPGIGIACLTILAGGTVSAFDTLEPSAVLHRIGTSAATQTSLQFLTPKHDEIAAGSMPAPVPLTEMPAGAVAALRDFRIERDREGRVRAHWCHDFADAAELERALDALVPLATATAHAAVLVGLRFHRVVVGPAGAHHLPMHFVASADDRAALKRIYENGTVLPAPKVRKPSPRKPKPSV